MHLHQTMPLWIRVGVGIPVWPAIEPDAIGLRVAPQALVEVPIPVLREPAFTVSIHPHEPDVVDDVGVARRARARRGAEIGEPIRGGSGLLVPEGGVRPLIWNRLSSRENRLCKRNTRRISCLPSRRHVFQCHSP